MNNISLDNISNNIMNQFEQFGISKDSLLIITVILFLLIEKTDDFILIIILVMLI